jgi:hypothetical protein
MGGSHTGFSFKSHFFLTALAVVAVFLILFWPRAAASKKTLGQCLTEKGVIMYGADSCENCANQKKLFGGDFGNVQYVNCEFHYQLCQEKGISVYPVWSFNDRTLPGTRPLTELSKFAGCEDLV